MQYKKYDGLGYNTHLIGTDKFKTNIIKVIFRKEASKIDITMRNLLTKILMEDNSKYSNKRLLGIKTEDLYATSVTARNSLSGNVIITEFSVSFLNDKYTEEGLFDKSLEFLMDIIFNPIVNFTDKSFEIVKKSLTNEINSLKENPRGYAFTRALEEIDTNTSLSLRTCGYLEDLEKITREDLYNYYLNMLKTNMVDIFVIGDVDFDNTYQKIKDNFKINTIKKCKLNHFINHEKIHKRLKQKQEKNDSKQSNLVMIYKLDKLTEFERNYVLPIYSYILGGGPDSRLFKTVREKYSLCYTVSSSVYYVSNLLTIYAGINAKDLKKTISLIKKEIKTLNNGDFNLDDINKAKTTILSTYKEIEDSQSAILNNYITHEILNYDLIKERPKKLKQVDKEMILKVAQKIKPEIAFCLEGDE